MAEVQDVSHDSGHLEWETPLFNQAITQFEQALPHAAVGDAVAERLRYPERSLIVSVPVQLDDGRWRRLPGLPRPALERARPDEGRHPLRPGVSISASAPRSRCG